ncbi:MAG TPA: DsbA family protein [Chloroflexi bacterium]|nr:DsbA family protein [Chloroflexota bacterium]
MTRHRKPRRPTGYRRKSRRRDDRWLKWGLIASGIVLLGLLSWFALRPLLIPRSSDQGYRTYEEFEGIRGVSFDGGITEYKYPDPASLGAGHKWLPSLGSEDAPVVLMTFSDFFCGHCRAFNLESLPDLLKRYVAGGDVRYVGHFFGFPQTIQAGYVHAAACAAEQGRYFAFEHAMYQSIELGSSDIRRAAEIAGIDIEAFQTCQESQRYAAAVEEMVLVDNRDVQGTPTFFVNDTQIVGNRPDQIVAAIEAILKEAP